MRTGIRSYVTCSNIISAYSRLTYVIEVQREKVN